MGVLFASGLLLIGLGLWGFRRNSFRAHYAGVGFMVGGAIVIMVGFLAMAGLIRE